MAAKYTPRLHPHSHQTGKFVETIDAPAWLGRISDQLVGAVTGGRAAAHKATPAKKATKKAPPRKGTPERAQLEKQLVRDYAGSGLSLRELADRHGVSQSFVHEALTTLGVQLRERGAPKPGSAAAKKATAKKAAPGFAEKLDAQALAKSMVDLDDREWLAKLRAMDGPQRARVLDATTAVELKRRAKGAGLPATGAKAALAERLDDHVQGKAPAAPARKAASAKNAAPSVPVTSLKKGDRAKVQGRDHGGQPMTLTGFLLGPPTPVVRHKGRRDEEALLGVQMAETPSGANGWRGVVYTAPDAVAQRVTGPSPEDEARARHAEIQKVAAVAKALTEVDELLDSEVDDKVLIRRIDSQGERFGIPETLRARLRAAIGDRKKLRAIVDRVARTAKLTPIDAAGAPARMDPKRHQSIDGHTIPAGSPVVVVRRGYVWDRPGEGEVRLDKAVVERSDEEEYHRLLGERTPTKMTRGTAAAVVAGNLAAFGGPSPAPTMAAGRATRATEPNPARVRQELLALDSNEKRRRYLDSLGIKSQAAANRLAKALGAQQTRISAAATLDNIVRYFDTGAPQPPRVGKAAARSNATRDPRQVRAYLDRADSREEADRLLRDFDGAELRAVAHETGTSLAGASTKDMMRSRIIEHTVGFRLNSRTIRGGSWANPDDGLDDLQDHQLRSLATEFEVPDARSKTREQLLRDLRQAGAVSPYRDRGSNAAPSTGGAIGERMSPKPILENHWGRGGGEVSFHEDGAIGQALEQMGPDRHLDVDGEPLANVLGRLATDGVRGRKTSQQVLDELKALRDRLPEGSRARIALNHAIKDMDSPARTVDLPDGTPEPIRTLMAALSQIPLARTQRRGSNEGAEIDRLGEIAQRFARGETGGGILIDEIRRLENGRHESQEGKFEVDRAVRRAVDDLEAQRRADPESLRPGGGRPSALVGGPPTEAGGVPARPLTKRQASMLARADRAMNGKASVSDAADADARDLHERGLVSYNPSTGQIELTARGQRRAAFEREAVGFGRASAPPDTLPASDAAIARQRRIDTARPAGQMAAELAELHSRLRNNDIPASEAADTLGQRLEAAVAQARADRRRDGVLPAGLDEVEAAARSRNVDRMQAAIAAMAAANGITLEGRPLDTVTLDRSKHAPVGNVPDGEQVAVMRPGVVFRDPATGERIQLEKAVVAKVDPERLSQARERTAAADRAQHEVRLEPAPTVFGNVKEARDVFVGDTHVGTVYVGTDGGLTVFPPSGARLGRGAEKPRLPAGATMDDAVKALVDFHEAESKVTPTARARRHATALVPEYSGGPERLLRESRPSIVETLGRQGDLAPATMLALDGFDYSPTTASRGGMFGWGWGESARYDALSRRIRMSPDWRTDWGRVSQASREGHDSGWFTPTPNPGQPDSALAHEYGHHVVKTIGFNGFSAKQSAEIYGALERALGLPAGTLYKPGTNPGKDTINGRLAEHSDIIRTKISGYAAQPSGDQSSQLDELLAEVWQEYSMMGENARPHIKEIGDIMARLAEESAGGRLGDAPMLRSQRPVAAVAHGRDVSAEVDYAALPREYNAVTHTDDALREIYRQQGFDGPPRVVSAAEFDEAVRRGEIREAWRGLSPSPFSNLTPEQIAQAYRTGDVHAGIGINGNGTYVAVRRADAEYYGPTLLRIGLRRDARIITADQLDAEMDAYFASQPGGAEHVRLDRQLLADLAKAKSPRAREKIRQEYRGTKFYGPDRRSRRLAIQRDPGRFAALRGYDAIEIPATRSRDKHAELIILNRTATLVQEA